VENLEPPYVSSVPRVRRAWTCWCSMLIILLMLLGVPRESRGYTMLTVGNTANLMRGARGIAPLVRGPSDPTSAALPG
jgi:hypothetical protein